MKGKEGHFIMMKESIKQENIITQKFHACNNIAFKLHKEKSLELIGETDKSSRIW